MIAPGRPHRLTPLLTLGIASLALAGCGDRLATAPTIPEGASLESSEGRGYFQRYVAIGTSISAGVQSDGLIGAFQQTAWPAQLARLAHREVSLPLVALPGCKAPLLAPLASNLRLNGLPANSAYTCAPNEPGVVLPTNVVAVDGARVAEALFGPNLASPERVDKNGRILPVGMTQVAAMKLQEPKIVSVELGANEVLGVTRGILIPNATIVPFATFSAQYTQLLDEVASANPKAAVLVGLVDDMRQLPSFRTGREIWDARASLAALGIVPTDACNTTNAENLIFTPLAIPTAIGLGAFTCADVPMTQDFVLTPGDQAAIDGLLAQMNAHIAAEAEARGWAFFKLDVLFTAPGAKPPYNGQVQFGTAQPYGPYVSLDGVHPSAAGQTLLARAAAAALNAKYGMEIPTGLEALLAAR